MYIAFQNLRHCAAGLLFAVSVSAADVPEPLAAALGRLRTAEAYTWTVDTRTPGAPFEVPPLKGWARASGAGVMESTVEQKPIQAAVLGARRVVKLDADWQTPSEAVAAKGAQAAEVARLLRIPLPGDELSPLLEHAATIRAEADGSFVAALSADAATEIIRAPMNDLPKRGFSPEIKGAAATIQLWLKDGALARYVISSTASLSLPFGTKEIKRTAAVELREIDAAGVVLPQAALSKLQAMANP